MARDATADECRSKAFVAAHDDTLDALHSEIASCRRCATAGYPIQGRPILSSDDPLSVKTAQTSRADQSRQVMLIGQAPGRREAAGGQPFMGPAGRRLFAWLERIGIDERSFRRQVYMTAVTKCYPGPSAGGHGDRLPSAAERALCRPFLERQVRLVNPSLVILVGRLAIETFLGKVRLAEAVGRSFERVERQWLPLPHPSGASTWLNRPRHQALLTRALALLRDSGLVKGAAAAPGATERGD